MGMGLQYWKWWWWCVTKEDNVWVVQYGYDDGSAKKRQQQTIERERVGTLQEKACWHLLDNMSTIITWNLYYRRKRYTCYILCLSYDTHWLEEAEYVYWSQAQLEPHRIRTFCRRKKHCCVCNDAMSSDIHLLFYHSDWLGMMATFCSTCW